jgi:hypothetical protein
MLMPLYGFLEGDTLGLLVLADETDSVEVLADKLQRSARVRVAQRGRLQVIHKGRRIEAHFTLTQAGIEALDRFDVVHDET